MPCWCGGAPRLRLPLGRCILWDDIPVAVRRGVELLFSFFFFRGLAPGFPRYATRRGGTTGEYTCCEQPENGPGCLVFHDVIVC